MLVSLHVKNLAIIDEIEVEFGEHLNILTGETGAGKSILIGSINIALGEKVSKDIIRKGADYALVELVFQVESPEILQKLAMLDLEAEEGQIIISRKITNKRAISKINGESVTLSVVRELSSFLLDIHGQHEHQSLLHKSHHLEIVDQYIGKVAQQKKLEIETYYEAYIAVIHQLEQLQELSENRTRELSFLEYEINEIESAKLVEGEEEELELIYKKLQNMDTIVSESSFVYGITNSGTPSVSEMLGRAARALNKVWELDAGLEEYCSQLEEIENLVSDFNRGLSDYMEGLTFDKNELIQIEERLDFIRNLKKKYGNTIAEIEQYYKKAKEKLDQYQNYENYQQRLFQQKEETENKLNLCCEELSLLRKQKAKELEQKMITAMEELNFHQVCFEIAQSRTRQYTKKGIDEIEFMISTNPGEELRVLSKVASGGELSRIMLAIKSVLAQQDHIGTLIFDEIDTGISGRTAQKVSEKLAVIAKEHQVICITHLPQIAAMADFHFIIEKITSNEITTTQISLLNEEEAIHELARMLGGVQITQAVLHSAKEMKQLAREQRKK